VALISAAASRIDAGHIEIVSRLEIFWDSVGDFDRALRFAVFPIVGSKTGEQALLSGRRPLYRLDVESERNRHNRMIARLLFQNSVEIELDRGCSVLLRPLVAGGRDGCG
jgi:hypothetical protein